MRRFLCRQSARTVSLLPDCLAANWSGTLAEVEQVVREAANRLRPDRVSLASALRWVRRRVQAVGALLTALCTLCSERFGRLEAFSCGLDCTAPLAADAGGGAGPCGSAAEAAATGLPVAPRRCGPRRRTVSREDCTRRPVRTARAPMPLGTRPRAATTGSANPPSAA